MENDRLFQEPLPVDKKVCSPIPIPLPALVPASPPPSADASTRTSHASTQPKRPRTGKSIVRDFLTDPVNGLLVRQKVSIDARQIDLVDMEAAKVTAFTDEASNFLVCKGGGLTL